jgi:hypothetical protein
VEALEKIFSNLSDYKVGDKKSSCPSYLLLWYRFKKTAMCLDRSDEKLPLSGNAPYNQQMSYLAMNTGINIKVSTTF